MSTIEPLLLTTSLYFYNNNTYLLLNQEKDPEAEKGSEGAAAEPEVS